MRRYVLGFSGKGEPGPRLGSRGRRRRRQALNAEVDLKLSKIYSFEFKLVLDATSSLEHELGETERGNRRRSAPAARPPRQGLSLRAARKRAASLPAPAIRDKPTLGKAPPP